MTIEEAVNSLLGANAGVTALVTPDKIKVPGPWENLARPYIIHFPVAPDPTYTMEGRAALTCWSSYQVSCFADQYSTARAISQAVVAALSGQHSGIVCFWRDQRPSYEADVRVHQIMLDFEVYEAL